MKHEIHALISYEKKQFIGLAVLGFLVLILEISFHVYKSIKLNNLPLL